MDIQYLADYPALIPQLARLHFDEWGYLRPEETLEERTARLAECCGRGGVPSVFVALEDSILYGSSMLIAHDMDTRADLTPWLAGVYVVAERRHRGYGSALVEHVESEAAAAGIERLSLYTPNASGFYLRMGWRIIEECQYLGHEVSVMSKSVTRSLATPAGHSRVLARSARRDRSPFSRLMWA